MKFVFNLVSFYCFSFLFRKSIPGFKRRIIIINLLNPGILFLNRKTSSNSIFNIYVNLGQFNIYLPAFPRVLSLLPLHTLHLKEVEVLPFKIHMLISNSFSLSQLSLKCLFFAFSSRHFISVIIIIIIIIIISYSSERKSNQIRTRSQNNEKQIKTTDFHRNSSDSRAFYRL